MNIHYKIFWNYFMISYWCHMRFFPMSVYVSTKQRSVYFFEETISVYFLNHLFCEINGGNSILIRNWNISCNKHQASKRIDLRFVCKSRTGCHIKIGMSHFLYVKPNPIFPHVVYDNLSMLCMTYFYYYFFVYIVYDIKSDLKNFYILYNIFHILQLKNKMSILTGVYGHVDNHILHKEEKNRRTNTALAYDQKEDEFLLYCPLYVKHLEDYTKTSWPWGFSTEYITEDKMWGF